ncbi:MAG: hypothetical protein J0L77_05305 [Alphaproteobacteria bacterium]|nr:hypothetical protein [Alphaproteobacteria bacterium]
MSEDSGLSRRGVLGGLLAAAILPNAAQAQQIRVRRLVELLISSESDQAKQEFGAALAQNPKLKDSVLTNYDANIKGDIRTAVDMFRDYFQKKEVFMARGEPADNFYYPRHSVNPARYSNLPPVVKDMLPSVTRDNFEEKAREVEGLYRGSIRQSIIAFLDEATKPKSAPAPTRAP